VGDGEAGPSILGPPRLQDLDDATLAKLYAYPAHGRWVRANFVSTLDGAIQGADGVSGSLSTPADTRVFALLRSLCDVVVVGAGTARAEGFRPVLPIEVNQELRSQLGLQPVPVIAVVTRSLDLAPELAAGGTAPTLVVTTALAAPAARGTIDPAHLITAGDDHLDVAAALDALADRGLTRVLVEGGPALLHDVIASGHLDELCLTVVPLLVGGDGHRMTRGDAITPPASMQLGHLLESEGQLFCRYTRAAPA